MANSSWVSAKASAAPPVTTAVGLEGLGRRAEQDGLLGIAGRPDEASGGVGNDRHAPVDRLQIEAPEGGQQWCESAIGPV